MDGLQVSANFEARLHRNTPVIILTGDISTGTSREIALQNYIKLDKPIKLKDLTQVIEKVMALPSPVERISLRERSLASGQPVIYVVDDDRPCRERSAMSLSTKGERSGLFQLRGVYRSLSAWRRSMSADRCLLPEMNGLELLRWLSHSGHRLPAIMITGNSDVPMAVQAMKAGAWDFIEKPIGHRELLISVENALGQSRNSSDLLATQESAARLSRAHSATTSDHGTGSGRTPSKNISADLGISQRTVENHRASIMEKTGSKSLPALARLAFAAAGNEQGAFRAGTPTAF